MRSAVGRITAVSFVVAALIGAGLGRQMASGHDPALSHKKAKVAVKHVAEPQLGTPQQSYEGQGQSEDQSQSQSQVQTQPTAPAAPAAPAQSPPPVVTRSS